MLHARLLLSEQDSGVDAPVEGQFAVLRVSHNGRRSIPRQGWPYSAKAARGPTGGMISVEVWNKKMCGCRSGRIIFELKIWSGPKIKGLLGGKLRETHT